MIQAWLKADHATWNKLGIRDIDSFKAWLDGAWPGFGVVHELTNGANNPNPNLQSRWDLPMGSDGSWRGPALKFRPLCTLSQLELRHEPTHSETQPWNSSTKL